MKTRSEKFPAAAPTTDSTHTANQPLPTFLDHVHELRRRLFWVVAAVLVASSLAYTFLNDIINVLTYPLGDERLFYLTPAGGLTFTFKLCTYFGFMVAVPAVMYHVYRFLEPLMGQWRRSALFYVGLSTLFAVSGVLFAYFVSLPAALHFLTGFNLNHIQAMLTVDSYLSFVITYLLGAALLFQIPLLLLIINTMTPLKPSKLMKSQRFVVVGAFLLGAVISPTPDIMNQTFLALPIIGMFQMGVLMVWLQNRSKLRREQRAAQAFAATPQPAPSAGFSIPTDVLQELLRPPQVPSRRALSTSLTSGVQTHARVVRKPAPARAFNDFGIRAQSVAPRQVRPAPIVRATSTPVAVRPAERPRTLAIPQRAVDGFMPYRTSALSSS